MTPTELQALRRLLFFPVDEAARFIGGVSPRSWQYWERGERQIPEEVRREIVRLCRWRADAIRTTDAQIAALRSKHGSGRVSLIWYRSLEDWLTLDREPVLWRPHCSVVAEIVARHGARLVPFDAPSYAAWLDGREDTEVMRSEWASDRLG